MNKWLKTSSCFLIVIFIFSLTFCSNRDLGKGSSNLSSDKPSSTPAVIVNDSQRDHPDFSAIDQSSQKEEKWKESFYFIRDEIRFEPSQDIYKFDQGLLWSRQGNAKEQALLLANLLRDEGEEVRIARGELSKDKASLLIEGIFPEKKNFGYSKDVLLSFPAQDRRLIQAVKDHWWVQIYKNDQWLDLDPSFPEAKIGQAFAPLAETFDSVDEDFFPTITISLEIEKGVFKKRKILNPETETVLEWEGSIKEVVNKPLTLKIVASFQTAEEEEEESGGLGGLFGGLSGGEKKASDEKSKKIEVIYHAHLIVNQKEVEEGSFSQIIPASSKQKVKETITKVALNFQFENPEGTTTSIERLLFQKNKRSQRPDYVQRHSILITANDIPQEAWAKDLKKVLGKERLESLKKELEEIKAGLKEEKNINKLYDKSISLEDEVGPRAGYLINMIFASTSDQISYSLGQALSVFSYYSKPRIIINTFEGTGDQLKVYLDLRQDSKQAVAFPGQAARMSETFLYGRGIIDSIL
ncbi:MAG: transglutaminase domain-containing protein, partial [Candidatus Aminicenantales bacterium]